MLPFVNTLLEFGVGDVSSTVIEGAWKGESIAEIAEVHADAVMESFSRVDAVTTGQLKELVDSWANLIKRYIEKEEEIDVRALLATNDISGKAVVVSLLHLMETSAGNCRTALNEQGSDSNKDDDDLPPVDVGAELSLLLTAARAYVQLLLLLSPSSPSMDKHTSLFHTIVFRGAMNSFRVYGLVHRRLRKGNDVDFDALAKTHCKPLLLDVDALLARVSLRSEETSLLHCMEILSELSHEETFHSVIPRVLTTLLSPIHGRPISTLRLLAKQILPVLVLVPAESRGAVTSRKIGAPVATSALPPVRRGALAARDVLVSFLKNIIADGSAFRINTKDAASSVAALLQHIMVRTPDKADYRNHTCNTITSLLQSLTSVEEDENMTMVEDDGENDSKNDVAAMLTDSVDDDGDKSSEDADYDENSDNTNDNADDNEVEAPLDHVGTFLRFVERVSKSKRIGARGFAVEVAAHVLGLVVDGTLGNLSMSGVLVRIVMDRCADRSPNVRTKAISGLAKMVEATGDDEAKIVSLENIIRQRHNPTMVSPTNVPNVVEGDLPSKRRRVSMTGPPVLATPPRQRQTPPDEGGDGEPVNDRHEDLAFLLQIAQRRADDDKLTVRKASVQLVSALGLLGTGEAATEQKVPLLPNVDFSLLVRCCTDKAVMVRKLAAKTLTQLACVYSHHVPVLKAWLDGVLPLVTDLESSLQDCCIESLGDLLLGGIVDNENRPSVWLLLSLVTSHHVRFMQRALFLLFGRPAAQKSVAAGDSITQRLANRGTSLTSLVKSLQKALLSNGCDDQQMAPEEEEDLTSISLQDIRNGAWLALSELSPFAPEATLNASYVVDAWVQLNAIPSARTVTTRTSVLRALSCVADRLPSEQKSSLTTEFVRNLEAFSSDHDLIRAYVAVLSTMHGGVDATLQRQREWAGGVLERCEAAFASLVMPAGGDDDDDDDDMDGTSRRNNRPLDPSSPRFDVTFQRYLFTLGEVCSSCPRLVPERIVTMVQALVTPHLDSILPSGSVVDADGMPKLSEVSRAYAFVTLGKLCLSKESYAKQCMSTFAQALHSAPSAAVRNNVMVVLCDLCRRHTILVDRHIPEIAICLRDESALVRRQSLVLLSRLIQQEYVKWKDALFYRFAVALVDSDAEVREIARYCLTNIATRKDSAMVFHHFIETIFTLNDHTDHPVYNQFYQSDAERKAFSLSGHTQPPAAAASPGGAVAESEADVRVAAHAKLRLVIYSVLLEHLTAEQKLEIQGKLCQDVLTGVIEGHIDVVEPGTGRDVVSDTLEILGSHEITSLTSAATLDSARSREASTEQEELMNEAANRILSKVIKKNVVENIVPIVIELKQCLEQKHSPLLGKLMCFLARLLKDYKDEVADILSSDPQLAEELDYDLRKYEAEQQQQRELAEQQRRLNQQQLQQAPHQTPARSAFLQGTGTPSTVSRKRRLSGMVSSPIVAAALDPTASTASLLGPPHTPFSVPRLRLRTSIGSSSLGTSSSSSPSSSSFASGVSSSSSSSATPLRRLSLAAVRSSGTVPISSPLSRRSSSGGASAVPSTPLVGCAILNSPAAVRSPSMMTGANSPRLPPVLPMESSASPFVRRSKRTASSSTAVAAGKGRTGTRASSRLAATDENTRAGGRQPATTVDVLMGSPSAPAKPVQQWNVTA